MVVNTMYSLIYNKEKHEMKVFFFIPYLLIITFIFINLLILAIVRHDPIQALSYLLTPK